MHPSAKARDRQTQDARITLKSRLATAAAAMTERIITRNNVLVFLLPLPRRNGSNTDGSAMLTAKTSKRKRIRGGYVKRATMGAIYSVMVPRFDLTPVIKT